MTVEQQTDPLAGALVECFERHLLPRERHPYLVRRLEALVDMLRSGHGVWDPQLPSIDPDLQPQMVNRPFREPRLGTHRTRKESAIITA